MEYSHKDEILQILRKIEEIIDKIVQTAKQIVPFSKNILFPVHLY